ncbi:alginate lyase family protein [Niabella sp. CC-SYL272]|uniref:alginate lyase family protein n=1 Tax=Niabella agricola TaxID=2891571 RepID=UPI001F4712D6|nr:alginate lyase family protein [Niabella agricola]MCF3108292.1 alginate lyase family protein [Niabella agricola]
MMRFIPFLLFTFLLFAFSLVVNGQSFIHPGILHSREDLARMKTAIQAQKEPAFSGYGIFAKDPCSQYTYKIKGPLDTVSRNPTVGQGIYDSDANAAHQNAIMWAVTGDNRYAQKAIEIINSWSATLKAIRGRDAVLMAGLGPFKMVNAAEIIRYTNAGWSKADITNAEKHFKEVIYPVIKNYAPFANGNWDAAALKTAMAIGVFCNDRAIFEDALRYYTKGGGNGSILNYVINANGQIQESGRDQPHAQLGIGMLAECCAIAWNQGLDLYGFEDNRLLKGFEYTAKYNLGNDDMPFQEWLDRTGKYHHYTISDKGRGALRPLYEQVYAHYVGVKRLKAPYVEAAVKKIRPEGAGHPGADHPGFGTLFFAGDGLKGNEGENKVDIRSFAPGGLIASGTGQRIELEWVAAAFPCTYSVQRSSDPHGKFQTIAEELIDNRFVDKNVLPGRRYYYTVTEEHEGKQSQPAFPQQAMAGLPAGWLQKDVGNIKTGNTFFDGAHFSIEAFGSGIGDSSDSFHYTYLPFKGIANLSVRIHAQPTSQFSMIGLMIRSDTSHHARFAALTLYPGKTAQIEEPEWHTRLETRERTAGKTILAGKGSILSAPAVSFGRLTGYYWLKLERKRRQLVAYACGNGSSWVEIGRTSQPFDDQSLIGIAVSSGMPNATRVTIDNIKTNGK